MVSLGYNFILFSRLFFKRFLSCLLGGLLLLLSLSVSELSLYGF